MAIAKKGLRKIVVRGDVYLWKLNGPVLIFPEKGEFSQLSVDYGWNEFWYYHGVPADEKMKSVTPKFVAAAISFARDHGWTDGNVKLVYKNELFSLAE